MASSLAKLAYDRAWRARNRERVRGYTQKYRAKLDTKKFFREDHIRRKYGLSPEQYDKLFAKQDFRCASCRGDDPNHKNGWQIDHDHQSGLVRGILCCPCNIALGFIENRPLVHQLETYLGVQR